MAQPGAEDLIEIASTSTGDQGSEGLQIIWHPDFDRKEVKYIKRCLLEFANLLNEKNVIPGSIKKEYLRVFAKHGVIISGMRIWEIFRVSPMVEVSAEKPVNLHRLLEDLSDMHNSFTTLNFINEHLKFSASEVNRRVIPVYKRNSMFQLWHSFLENDQHAIELVLSSHPNLRLHTERCSYKEMQNMNLCMASTEDDNFSRYTSIFYIALQAVIQNFRTRREFVGEQIVQLTHAHIINVGELWIYNDVLGHMTEALICAMGLKLPKAQDEIAAFDALVPQRSRTSEYLVRWMAWKMVAFVARRPRSEFHAFSMEAERLAAYADAEEDEEMKMRATVFVEMACLIWKCCRQSEHKITDAIVQAVQNFPQLGPRMVALAVDCGVDYEKDSIIDEACSKIDAENGLNPCEPLWLEWVERRLVNITRFGPVKHTIDDCVKVLFRFLDYTSNRESNKGWSLLHDAVQKALPEMVQREWASRADWWPQFHALKPPRRGESRPRRAVKVEQLSPENEHKKAEILAALVQLGSVDDRMEE